MKKYLLLFILNAPIILSAQNWCPSGAKWLYRGISQTSQLFYQIEYVGDTTMAGQNLKKLSLESFQFVGIPGTPLVQQPKVFLRYEYFHESNDTIYWYHQGSFQQIYVFTGNVGTNWAVQANDNFTCNGAGTVGNIVTISQIHTDTFGGSPFQTYTLNGQVNWSIGQVIEGIGSKSHFFPQPAPTNTCMIDGQSTNMDFLLCYQDDNRGTLKIYDGLVNNLTCVDMLTSTHSIIEEESLKIILYPNPASQTFKIQSTAPIHNGIVSIYNLMGQLVHQTTFNLEKSINISHLRQGMYLVQIANEEQVLSTQKILKL